jgi:hypothetical protein
MDLKSLGHMDKLFDLTRKMVIPYEKMPQHYISPKLMNTPHSLIKVTTPRSSLQQDIRKSVFT